MFRLIAIYLAFCLCLQAVYADQSCKGAADRIKELENRLKACTEEKNNEIPTSTISWNINGNALESNKIVAQQQNGSEVNDNKKHKKGKGHKDRRLKFLQESLDTERKRNDELWTYIAGLEKHITQKTEEISETKIPKDCRDFRNWNVSDYINVTNIGLTPCPCYDHLAGHGWTVIQRRFNGSVDFYRTWDQYRKGFGNFNGEFFIGLDRLHNLTASIPHELHIQLEDFENETRYAGYSNFVVGNLTELYNLKSLGNYTGNAGNALVYNLNQNFSTYDMDNDFDDENCAEGFHGAWWYKACGASNLNGQYITNNTLADADDLSRGIGWDSEDWHEFDYSYKTVTMMIRPSGAN